MIELRRIYTETDLLLLIIVQTLSRHNEGLLGARCRANTKGPTWCRSANSEWPDANPL